MMASDQPAHGSAATAMNRMYGWQHAIYDVTRKPYLLGRDRLIASIAPPAGGAVLEIGCGTGRNLIAAARLWPHARFYGYDVSAVMLDHARKAVRRAGLDARIALAQGDACNFDPHKTFGAPRFDRIYISYVLSMIPGWRGVLAGAADLLQPGASLHVADFGDQHGLGAVTRATLNTWLSMFHVEPRLHFASELSRIASDRGMEADCQQIYAGYAFVACLRSSCAPAALPDALKRQAV